MARLKAYLANLSLARLRETAIALGLTADEFAGKPKLLEAVATFLTDRAAVESLLRSLPRDQSEALALLGAHNGKLPVEEARRRLRPAGAGDDAPDPAPMVAVMRLGLVFRAFEVVSGFETPVYLTPDEILPLLPQPQAPLPMFSLEMVAAPARHRDDQIDLLRDVVALLSFCRENVVEEDATGHLPQEVVHRLDARLLHMSSEDRDLAPAWNRTQFIYGLCRRIGLLTVQNRVATCADQKRLLAWLSKGHYGSLMDLWRAWRTDVLWNEMLMDGQVRQDRGPRLPVPEARRALLRLMERCVSLGWVTLESFEALVESDSPQLLRPGNMARQWELVHAESGRALDGEDGWRHAEGRFVRWCVGGPLTWLGVLAVGDLNGRRCFNVTPLGAALLADEQDGGIQLPYEFPHVQSDFSIYVPYWSPLDALYALESFAEPRRHDRLATYELTQQSVGHALQRGMTLEQMLAVLQAGGSHAIPPTVTKTLGDWCSRFGRLRIRRVYLVESPDSGTLDEVGALPRVRQWLQARQPGGAFEVKEDDVPSLLTMLEEEGMLPQVQSDEVRADGAASQSDLLNLLAATETLIELAGSDRVWPASLTACVNRLRARLDRPALNLLQAKRHYLLRLARERARPTSARPQPPPSA